MVLQQSGWTRYDAVRNGGHSDPYETTNPPRARGEETPAEDEATVEQAALMQVAVVREHSMTIHSDMELLRGLMQELEVCTTRNDELLAAIDATEKDDKRRFAAHQSVSLQARAGVMRDLAHSARLWVQLERQAFRISDDRDRNTASPIEQMTEAELEASILEDLRVLGIGLPTPAKP
jgi:hypothetical protein